MAKKKARFRMESGRGFFSTNSIVSENAKFYAKFPEEILYRNGKRVCAIPGPKTRDLGHPIFVR
jgi:hypothetical protein